MKFLVPFFSIFFICIIVRSQDVHLTQYYTSNLSLNPAYTGNYNGDIRIVANYRSQWKQVTAPIQTNFLSVEKKIVLNKDEVGVGLILMNDRLNLYSLNTNKAYLSISYQKNFNDHILHIGMQGGIVMRTTDLSGQTFPDQWQYVNGNYSLPNNETGIQNKTTYPSINLGAGWSHKFGNKKLTAGYALFNTNKPKDSFVSNNQSLPLRHVFNASLAWHLANKLTLLPQVLFMRTAKANDFIIGSNIRKNINKDVAVLIGLSYRNTIANSDAFMAIAGLSYKRLDFGFSLDFNDSQLSRQSQSKSALEFSLIYTTPSVHPNKAAIPCDRY